jgi:hypothetical protein
LWYYKLLRTIKVNVHVILVLNCFYICQCGQRYCKWHIQNNVSFPLLHFGFSIVWIIIFSSISIVGMIVLTKWISHMQYKYMHYEKKGVLQLALQLTIFLCCEWYWTSCMNCKVATRHIYSATQLQLCRTTSTTMQLHYNYSHNVMLTSIKTWHVALWRFLDFFWTIDFHNLLWLLMARYYNTWPNKKMPYGILIKVWKII